MKDSKSINTSSDPYINRDVYIDKIKPFINKNLIKVIVGQRRVGKSYLVFQIMDFIKREFKSANIIYINKESFDFDELRNYKDLNLYVSSKIVSSRPNFLFIDEIQDILGFEKSLRHFALYKNIDIYCTGSNANLLSGELASYLSGRYVEFKIYSLSYKEFLLFHAFENNQDNLKKYLYWGGLPYLKNLNKSEAVIFEYLKNIYSTIIYKDVIAMHNIRNTFFLENLVKYLAGNIGNIISAKKISDYLKSQNLNLSPQIVLNYLDYLKQAFLIYNVKRTDISGKRNFEINEKFYFEDWGISNAILGINNMDVSRIIENVIFIHQKINGYHVKVGKSGEKEIDFVCEKEGKKIYIQACYLIADNKVKQREFGSLLEVKNNYPKIVVSLDDYTFKNYEGVIHLHLKEFLSTYS